MLKFENKKDANWVDIMGDPTPISQNDQLVQIYIWSMFHAFNIKPTIFGPITLTIIFRNRKSMGRIFGKCKYKVLKSYWRGVDRYKNIRQNDVIYQ